MSQLCGSLAVVVVNQTNIDVLHLHVGYPWGNANQGDGENHNHSWQKRVAANLDEFLLYQIS